MKYNKTSEDSFDSAENRIFPETILCLSHLRWDFVFQRPQHLFTRLAKRTQIYFIEEPVYDSGCPRYEYTTRDDQLVVAVPHLPDGSSHEEGIRMQRELLASLCSTLNMRQTAIWYYTPMALKFSNQLEPAIRVFDCMDELSAFKNAPSELKAMEVSLLSSADVLFTGGASLYEAKKGRHSNVHLFPSSIDRAHFAQARGDVSEPQDQAAIAHPRLGFFGVIDERFDVRLIEQMALQRPEWHIILVGPVVKIDPASLPKLPNIHYLGSRPYQDLPAYLFGWDIALIPFALNESTRFISPTKTPEYLAAGIPVISTPIKDVVEPYGNIGLVRIASNAEEFISEAETIFSSTREQKTRWLNKIDSFLEGNSWEKTCSAMEAEISKALHLKQLQEQPAPMAIS